jgi:hypothetical protein
MEHIMTIFIHNFSSSDVIEWNISNMVACFDGAGSPSIKGYVKELQDIRIITLDSINKMIDKNVCIVPYTWWKNDIQIYDRYYELHLQLEKIQNNKKDSNDIMKEYFQIMYALLYKLKYRHGMK